MKVADYIIQELSNHTDYIFQVYGSATASLIDAFTRLDKPKLICGQHEQACGFMAEGYTKVTGKIGVVIATSGPGITNAITSICNAFYDSFPAIYISGQVHSKFMRPNNRIRQRGFQETDIISIVKGITKYARCIKNAEDIKYELEKAIYLANSGRKGPVLLDIPLDIQKEEIEPEKLIGFIPYTQSFNEKDILKFRQSFWEDLQKSHKPAILIGGGVSKDSINKIYNLCNKLKIPVFPTWNAIDIITSDFPYYAGRIGTYGGAGRNLAIQECDLLLALGTRISGRITGGNPPSFAKYAKKYLVNIDISSLENKYQEVQFEHNLLCDSDIFLDYLNNNIPDFSFEEWFLRCKELKNKYDCVSKEYYKEKNIIHPYVFTRILSEEMSAHDVLAFDCGGNAVTINHAFETKQGQTIFSNHGNSPMGGWLCYGLGAYLGSKLYKKSSNVIALGGDGGLMVNLQELQTIISYNLKPKLICLNNKIYGITAGYQKSNYDSRHIACGYNKEDYHPCNFINVSRAFGIDTLNIGGPIKDYEEVREKIRLILEHPGPLYVDVDCTNFCDYLPKIKPGWNYPIDKMIPEVV